MRTRLFFLVITLSTLACMERVRAVPSPTVTPKPSVTLTSIPEIMPAVATETPQISTEAVSAACFTVSASEAVYLRPSPSMDNYPIAPLPNGSRVIGLGGRDGAWVFVALGDKQGWVNAEYLQECE